jgi:hypothetical protein
MKLTNNYGIPQTFMNVLARPTYSKGKAHLSATQLLNSPKIVALTNKFDNELEQDASDMIWSILGSAVHNFLEHGKDENNLVEERLHIEHDGWKISGAVDLQILNDNGIDVRDYKFTSVWAVMNEKIDWELQLNIYAWLIEKVKKTPVTSLGILAILRDWKPREKQQKEGYPDAPVKEVPIRLWTMEEREQYVSNRISAHSACEFELETGGNLPDCSPDEMWEKPAVWAVRKTGNVRAKSLHDNEASALQALEELGKGYEIEFRAGERTRCESYCLVNTYCQQYRDYKESK